MHRLALTALAALAAVFAPPQEGFPRLSPFSAVRLDGPEYEVELDGEWYVLVSLDGLAAADIRRHCDATYGERSEKRFAEDLVQVLAGMGHEVGRAVDLVLLERESGARVAREDVPMTEENRRRVYDARNARDSAPPRVVREHASEPSPDYAPLAAPLAWPGWDAAPRLSRRQAEEDLDQLEWAVRHTYSYRDLCGVDVSAAFDAVRLGVRDGARLGAFADQLARLVALFGDGHTRVRGAHALRVPGHLPFLLEDARGGLVAFHPDRSGWLDPERPFLRAIDGRPVDAWLGVVSQLGAQGSPTWRRALGLYDLGWFGHARALAGAQAAPEVELELTDAAGGRARTLRLPLAAEPASYGAWPRLESRWLEGRVGYLRIAEMRGEPEFLRGIEEALERFADASALVIDVRGNGGGSRDVLRLVAPRLLALDAEPLVCNVAAYRLKPGDEPGRAEGYLANRFLFPLAWPGWTPAERAAIERCAARFAPDWPLPAGEFSAWHYMALSPAPEGAPRLHDRPVLVLQDSACYSATDVFLGALEPLPNVTLLGAPSGGGSGRSQPIRLAHSGLELRLSTMASFRPDGRRYDGVGVTPDVALTPIPTDFLVGGTDSVLEAALARLRGK